MGSFRRSLRTSKKTGASGDGWSLERVRRTLTAPSLTPCRVSAASLTFCRSDWSLLVFLIALSCERAFTKWGCLPASSSTKGFEGDSMNAFLLSHLGSLSVDERRPCSESTTTVTVCHSNSGMIGISLYVTTGCAGAPDG